MLWLNNRNASSTFGPPPQPQTGICSITSIVSCAQQAETMIRCVYYVYGLLDAKLGWCIIPHRHSTSSPIARHVGLLQSAVNLRSITSSNQVMANSIVAQQKLRCPMGAYTTLSLPHKSWPPCTSHLRQGGHTLVELAHICVRFIQILWNPCIT